MVMVQTLEKKKLKDGYYYAGHIMRLGETYTVGQHFPTIIGKWDDEQFWFWEYEGNKKILRKLKYLFNAKYEDISGFAPVKEIMPLEEEVI
jgi:hypothetical protein